MLLVLAQASDSPSSPIFDRVAPWIQAGLLLLFLILMAGVVIWVLLQLARAAKGSAGDAEPPSAPPAPLASAQASTNYRLPEEREREREREREL